MMIINDIWGRIAIESKYEPILNSKEFTSLKNKTQLGLNCNVNATHTRYQHSIGTYYLACKLIEICKSKFSDRLFIDEKDEQAIKCMALVHDIGHGCFSHVSEKHLEGTHEDRTERLLKDENTEIHKAIVSSFGKDVLERTIELLKLKEKIKTEGKAPYAKNLVFIISKLLSGGIDIDRIDYIFRDSRYALGEDNDFSSILDSIDLACIDGTLEIVFEKDAEFKLANFFNKRFEMYDTVYLSSQTRMLESIFGKFLEATGTTLTWDTTEIEMNNIFRENLESDDPVIKRYASLLVGRKIDSNIIIKECSTEKEFSYLKERLLAKVPILRDYEQLILSSSTKVSIYNKANKVFIDRGGLIQDISESSKILNSSLQKENYILAVDTYLLKLLLAKDKVPKEQIDSILDKIEKVMAPEIEQEKKYVFTDDINMSPEEAFSEVRSALGLTSPKIVNNIDTYYDYNSILESYRIAVRKRVSEGKVEWTVKRPLNDKTSISKRAEKNFATMEEVIRFLKTQWNIPIDSLSEVVTLKTQREKYNLEYADGFFEVVFDKTTPNYNGEDYEEDYMVECELKKGNSAGLFFIDNLIKNLSFIKECTSSKKERALSQIRNKNKQNTIDLNPPKSKAFYDKEIATFFVGNLELLEDLKALDEKKQEIKRLREKFGDLKTPLVVTITGTPRAGKTTCVENLTEFLRKAGLNVTELEEPAGIIYAGLKNREEKQRLLQDRIGFVEKQYEVGLNDINLALPKSDIIICDRGVLDPFVWYDMYYKLGMMDDARYYGFLSKLSEPKDYLECLYALYASSDTAMIRDYINSLSIEPRSTMNKENVERYNVSLLRMLPILEGTCDTTKLIDTTPLARMDASLEVANNILERVKKLY